AVPHVVGEATLLQTEEIRQLFARRQCFNGAIPCCRDDLKIIGEVDVRVHRLPFFKPRIEVVDVQLVVRPGGERHLFLSLNNHCKTEGCQAKSKHEDETCSYHAIVSCNFSLQKFANATFVRCRCVHLLKA